MAADCKSALLREFAGASPAFRTIYKYVSVLMKNFSELSERDLFKLLKKILKRSYKMKRHLLINVRCVRY